MTFDHDNDKVTCIPCFEAFAGYREIPGTYTLCHYAESCSLYLSRWLSTWEIGVTKLRTVRLAAERGARQMTGVKMLGPVWGPNFFSKKFWRPRKGLSFPHPPPFPSSPFFLETMLQPFALRVERIRMSSTSSFWIVSNQDPSDQKSSVKKMKFKKLEKNSKFFRKNSKIIFETKVKIVIKVQCSSRIETGTVKHLTFIMSEIKKVKILTCSKLRFFFWL